MSFANPRITISAFEQEFRRYRRLSEESSGQISWEQLRIPLDTETNSIAIIMKHVAGNLRSRWTDPFTTDGEKPWRNRDLEFADSYASREELLSDWNAGWAVVESVLAECSDSDLPRMLTIRGEPHTLALALARSLSHIAYHSGQIVQASRVLASQSGASWKTLTVPRGRSSEYNKGLGFDPGTPKS